MEQKYRIHLGSGILSVLMVFVVICLTALGVLSLVSAQEDLKLSAANEKAVSSFYQADAQAEQSLCALDGLLSDCQALAWEAYQGASPDALITRGISLHDGFLVYHAGLQRELSEIEKSGLSEFAYAQAVYRCFSGYAVKSAGGNMEQEGVACFEYPLEGERVLRMKVALSPWDQDVHYQIMERGISD